MQVLSKMQGSELAGRTYQPLLPHYAHLRQPASQNGHANGTFLGPFR